MNVLHQGLPLGLGCGSRPNRQGKFREQRLQFQVDQTTHLKIFPKLVMGFVILRSSMQLVMMMLETVMTLLMVWYQSIQRFLCKISDQIKVKILAL